MQRSTRTRWIWALLGATLACSRPERAATTPPAEQGAPRQPFPAEVSGLAWNSSPLEFASRCSQLGGSSQDVDEGEVDEADEHAVCNASAETRLPEHIIIVHFCPTGLCEIALVFLDSNTDEGYLAASKLMTERYGGPLLSDPPARHVCPKPPRHPVRSWTWNAGGSGSTPSGMVLLSRACGDGSSSTALFFRNADGVRWRAEVEKPTKRER